MLIIFYYFLRRIGNVLLPAFGYCYPSKFEWCTSYILFFMFKYYLVGIMILRITDCQAKNHNFIHLHFKRKLRRNYSQTDGNFRSKSVEISYIIYSKYTHLFRKKKKKKTHDEHCLLCSIITSSNFFIHIGAWRIGVKQSSTTFNIANVLILQTHKLNSVEFELA